MKQASESKEFSQRYEVIDKANEHSWYMTDPGRPFDVFMSVSSAGKPREKVTRIHTPEEVQFINERNKAARFVLGGNMSTIRQADGKVPYGPKEMTDEERLADAWLNTKRFLEQLEVSPADVRVLNPERDYSMPLSVVNADEDHQTYQGGELVRLEKSGDFVYTYNPELVLAVRPADCPIAVISAETPKGRLYGMIHFAWRGSANGQYEDMARELDALGVDRSNMSVYITPGGHAESYQFDNYTPNGANNPEPTPGNLFTDLKEFPQEDGSMKYSFNIDTPNDVYQAFKNLGLSEKQLFLDTSDTTALNSGYASHGRAMRQKESNVRDLVIVKLHEVQTGRVVSNPERPTPPEVLKQIVPLEVNYVDFNGEEQVGVIEVNEAVADDVRAFFEAAKAMHFPIEKVVRSSDEPYGWKDSRLTADNATSAFNYRVIARTGKMSLHALGRAFDVNPRINPFIVYDEDGNERVDPPGVIYDPSVLGALSTDHPLVTFMKERGWEWGGDWTKESGRIDYQHFQKPD